MEDTTKEVMRLYELEEQELPPTMHYSLVMEAECFLYCEKWESLKEVFKFRDVENLKKHVKSLREELKLMSFEIVLMLREEKF